MKIAALILFALMYILMITKPQHRPFYALAAAVIYVVTGILPAGRVPSVVNWNVLLMISGTMVLVYYFIASGMPSLLADLILSKAGNVKMTTIYMSLFAGLVSAFIDNVATVLMIAPVGLAICRKLKINPVSMILSISVASNLQGAATLVGDTTSIMLADHAGMNFMDFFWMRGRPGIFFAVELGTIAIIPVMLFIFRKNTEKVESGQRTEVKDKLPTVMLVGMVAALITASFLPDLPSITNGVICCSMAVLMMLLDTLRKHKAADAAEALKSVDLETLGLLVGLFIVIGGLTEVGIINDFADWIIANGSGSTFVLYTIIVWGSVAVSAFVDNIPYVATMLPVLTVVTKALGMEPYLLYFGLLTGATLGGNITPVGASANITAGGLLKKEGYDVTFKEFVKIGVPYTLTAVVAGYLFIWFVWK